MKINQITPMSAAQISINQIDENVELSVNNILLTVFNDCRLIYHPMDCSLNVMDKDNKLVCDFQDCSEYDDTIIYDTNIEI